MKCNIKNIREDLGLSQKEFSKKLNISITTLSSWETETTFPTFKTVIKICNTFKIDPNTVYDYKEKSINISNLNKDIASSLSRLVNIISNKL